MYFVIIAIWDSLHAPTQLLISNTTIVERDPSPCPTMLYDKNGKGYSRINYYQVSYRGEGQLFMIEPQKIKAPKNTFGCLVYPVTIDPLIATQGLRILPAEVYIYTNKEKFISGETFEIEAKVEITDSFTEKTFILESDENQKAFLEFHLDAPNFEFSPTEDQTIPVVLFNNYPALHTWIVAPKEKADGMQIITIRIDGNRFYIKKKIEFELRKAIGISSSTIAVITLISTIISQLLQNIKDGLEILKLNLDKK